MTGLGYSEETGTLVSFLRYTVYRKCRQHCKLRSKIVPHLLPHPQQSQKRTLTILIGINTLVLQDVKFAPTSSDPDSNRNVVRVDVQRALPANTAPSALFHPKGR